MIDPLAGLWTVRRSRKRGRRRLVRKLPFGNVLEWSASLGIPGIRLTASSHPEALGADVGAVVGVAAVGAVSNGAGGGVGSGVGSEVLASAVSSLLDDSPAGATSAFQASVLDAEASLFGLPRWNGPSRSSRRRRSTRRSGPSAPGGLTRKRAAARPVHPLVAIPLLVVLLVVAAGLVVTIDGLVRAAIYKASGASAAAAPLARPVPGTAGGFRQHYEPLQNPETIALIAEFEHRFRLFSGTTTREPAGLFREPATVDVISDQPGWIKYQGFNSVPSLGRPAVAVSKLISDLIQASGPDTSWRAAPGARGGSARCAITTILHIRVSVCAWATEHTAGALISPDADTRGDELAVLMPLMRLDLQPG